MPDHATCLVQSATLILVTLLALVPRPCDGSCEVRCERSIPLLTKLRSHWSRSFKRFGEQRVSFEQFLLSLVQTSASDDQKMNNLRFNILYNIGRYQDCVMACEHQFSKRDGRWSGRSPYGYSLFLPKVSASTSRSLFFHPPLYTQNGRDLSQVT
ncbi:uncharacterized protein LOC131953439 [Physella acuta]|uniref:uncharacterized protein LOC131953439 n=1 Tax=Physella acuta TaxID=109671 RepID=UPI0027DC9266|nr:uncharacterized protein LOC131953439 [Physella acuta]